MLVTISYVVKIADEISIIIKSKDDQSVLDTFVLLTFSQRKTS